MVLRTTIEIKEGEELFCSYTGSLQPTMLRRDNLQFGKYFGCSCPRCSDPLELGTNMSSINCADCGLGVLLSTNPLDEEAFWECTECHYTVPGIGVKRMFMEIKTDTERLERMPLGPEKIDSIEQVLEKYSGMLHENNALNAGLWYDLIQLYGKVEGYTLDMLPDELYEHKINLCRKLLSLLDIIEPGYTRIRGIILYEYHTVLLMVAKMKFEYKEITLYQFKQLMLEVRRVLDESVSILSLEPESCPEGKLAIRAANSLIQLTASINIYYSRMLV